MENKNNSGKVGEMVERCKELHKDYVYMLWTDDMMEEFVKKEYPDFYETYRKYPYQIQRCDSFRWLVLYKYGGIYLDLDIECKKSLDEFRKYDLVITRSFNITSSITNSFMMSIPKHNFVKKIIEKLKESYNVCPYFGKHINIMTSTGSYFLTNMVNKYLIPYYDEKSYYIMSGKEYGGDCNVCNTECDGGKYFYHIVDESTWNNVDTHILNYLMCNKKIIIIIILLFLILYLLFKHK